MGQIKEDNLENIFERSPDVEVVFEFNDIKTKPIYDGYRPAHLVKDDYLTTGIHKYNEVECVYPNTRVKGTITFITPEAYPNCLWIGKEIIIQEGSIVVGKATVVKVLNKTLEVSCER